MTDREKIIKWGVNAGILYIYNGYVGVRHSGHIGQPEVMIEKLKRLADLAYAAGQADEREACLSVARDAKKGATMSKYATSAECRAARDMAKKIDARVRARIDE
jgi:hypothetical protein